MKLLDRKQDVICVFFDHRKAFDSVSHRRLMEWLSTSSPVQVKLYSGIMASSITIMLPGRPGSMVIGASVLNIDYLYT